MPKNGFVKIMSMHLFLRLVLLLGLLATVSGQTICELLLDLAHSQTLAGND